MKIYVSVHTNASHEGVTKIDTLHYKVSTHATPEKGKANRNVRELLGTYFHVSPSCVHVVAGECAHKKIIEIIS
ncbi:MAG: DUF167 domain-containing protein [Patescibacteria group bacterium]|nr:DUF167 domain-containing protein [Patescibacteria group bacterium]MDE2438673.1 DUF167 domain-containing protein [Patescibacteria group bacterium]